MEEPLAANLWPTLETVEQAGFFGALDGYFLLSYLLGLVVLMWVSWQRLFNEHYAPHDENSEKVFRMMPPGTLRGTLTVMRAFAVYTLLIGSLYTMIALGGSFLWDLYTRLGVSEFTGIPETQPPFAMDDPAWPLGVSLAFVGLFSQIPKLDVIERTIRRWAHRSIGIPPYIRERTREVLAAPLLEMEGIAPLNYRDAENKAVGALAQRVLGQERADDMVRRLDRLTIMDRMILEEQANWPSVRIKSRFDPMLREIRRDQMDLFDQADGARMLLEGVPVGAADDNAQHKAQVKRMLTDLDTKAETVHRDTSALIAVFIENEPKPREDASPVVERFIQSIHERSTERSGLMDRILAVLLILGAIVFSVTWLATLSEFNPPIGTQNATVTAAMQSLLVLLAAIPSMLVGLAVRESKVRQHRWLPWKAGGGPPPLSQYCGVFGWGYLVALPLIVLYYLMFWQVAVTDAGEAMARFVQFMPGYFVMAALGGFQAVFAAYAVSEVDRSNTQGAIKLATLHAVCAAIVVVFLYAGLASRMGYQSEMGAVMRNLFDVARAALVGFAATYISAQTRSVDEEDEPAIDHHDHGPDPLAEDGVVT